MYHSFLNTYLAFEEDIIHRHKEKLLSIEIEYHNASKYPRKKKKKIRKECIKDYNFFTWLNEQQANLF